MILVDSNLLLYATTPVFKQHAAARAWLLEAFNGEERVGLPWPSLLGFVRILTNPRVVRPPVPLPEAWAEIMKWLASPCVWIPTPTAAHPQILGRLVREELSKGELIMDAHLAALAIEHGLTLCSTDRDFARFTGLKWRNPLAERS